MATSDSSAVTELLNNSSVFSTGYIGGSIAVTRRSYTTKAYIKSTNSFYEFLLQSVTERHAESFVMQNSLAESIIVHSTGAKPIEVTLHGYFTAATNLDSRMKFLSYYSTQYRPGVLRRTNKEVQVYIRDTSFKFLITGVDVQETVSMEEFALIAITGYAYNYTTTEGVKYQQSFFGSKTKAYVEIEATAETDKKTEETASGSASDNANSDSADKSSGEGSSTATNSDSETSIISSAINAGATAISGAITGTVSRLATIGGSVLSLITGK